AAHPPRGAARAARRNQGRTGRFGDWSDRLGPRSEHRHRVPAAYTNFGKRIVYLSAPGGQFTLGPNGPIPTLPPDLDCDLGFGLGVLPCWHFDGIFTTAFFNPVRPSFYRSGFGTSFAAPHVAGVAALVIGKHGSSMLPNQVQAILRKSADDLGPAGRDASHRWGPVDSERGVGVTP